MDNAIVPIPPTPLQPAVPPSVKTQNHRWFLWLLGGLFVLALGIAVGLFSAKFLSGQFPNQPVINSYADCLVAKGSIVQESYPATCVTATGRRFTQPISSPTPESVKPTADPTADWKTYNNTEYNYSLKYPPNLTVGENGMSRGNVQKATAVVLYEDKTVTFESPRFAVTVRSDPDSFENIVQKHYKKITTNLLSETEKQTASKNLGYTISDNKAISPIINTIFLKTITSFQYTIMGSTVDDGTAEYGVPQEEHKYIWFEANQKFFLISFTSTSTMNQILSTFTFLN